MRRARIIAIYKLENKKFIPVESIENDASHSLTQEDQIILQLERPLVGTSKTVSVATQAEAEMAVNRRQGVQLIGYDLTSSILAQLFRISFLLRQAITKEAATVIRTATPGSEIENNALLVLSESRAGMSGGPVMSKFPDGIERVIGVISAQVYNQPDGNYSGVWIAPITDYEGIASLIDSSRARCAKFLEKL